MYRRPETRFVATFIGSPPMNILPGRVEGPGRVSVGGHFAFAALGALVEAATEFREQGTYGFVERSRAGGKAARAAFGKG